METPKAYSYIRFSTPKQEEGDSLRRQTDYSRQIAVKLGLVLDDVLRLTDKGLSAYKGDHRTKGALGEFLKLVDNNKIAVGSCLIIEHLDRLSREGLLEATHLLTGILLKGIDLYTAMDDKHFQKSTYDSTDLIISAIKLEQGHEESEKKSIRLKAAWVSKRLKAVKGECKLTAQCPYWLKLSEDKTKFEVNHKAEAAINLIFDMKLKGKGSESIAKELNQSMLWKPSGRKDKLPSWRKSYINKLLHNNRALIGEFQPYIKVNGKRLREGEPILGYYPSIISIEKYNRVQALIQANLDTKGYAGGRNGKMSSLFRYMVFCGVCGFPMQYKNKGYSSKGGQYLICDKEVRKIEGGCTSKMVRYDIVEENILKYCEGLNIVDILPDDNQTIKELTELQNHLQSIDGEIIEIKRSLEITGDIVVKTPNEIQRKIYLHRELEFIARQEKLELEKKVTQSRINTLLSNEKNTKEQLNNIRDLIEKMKELEGQERLNLRLALRNQLRRLINKIRVFTKKDSVVIFFQSGMRRGVNLSISKITMDAYPLSEGFITTSEGLVKKK